MIQGLNHLTLAVADLDRSLSFYREGLGFRAEVRWKQGAYLSLGSLWLCLSLGPVDPSSDASHIAFGVEAVDFENCRNRLLAAGARPWRADLSEGASFYFLDPDGHRLEIHVGDLSSRLASLRERPYSDLEWL